MKLLKANQAQSNLDREATKSSALSCENWKSMNT